VGAGAALAVVGVLVCCLVARLGYGSGTKIRGSTCVENTPVWAAVLLAGVHGGKDVRRVIERQDMPE